jgi:hypothetical protein
VENWQRLWSLLTVSPSELLPLRDALSRATTAEPVALGDAVESLPPSVRWVAEENLTRGPAVIAVLIELLDLILAGNATSGQHGSEIGGAILRYEWLTRSNEPARNGRCYCGSGKKYKLCHGANGDEQRRAVATRRNSGK